MRKIWLVMQTTYRRRLRSGTFLLLTFGLPLLMVVAGAIPVLMMRDDTLPTVGVVDQAGLVRSLEPVQTEQGSLALKAYADEQLARSAQEAGEIGGYLLIPSGYAQGEPVAYFGERRPGTALEEGLRRFLRSAMLGENPAWLLERLENPSVVSYKDIRSGEILPPGPSVLIQFIAPAVLALLFALSIFTGASQMGSIMVREKEQRAMEIMLTSLSPRQLVTGKIAGMTLLSLTQLAIWFLGGVIALVLLGQGELALSELRVPWNVVGWSLLLGVPAYFLYAALAAGVGIIAGDSQQAQQLAGLLSIAVFAPFWLTVMLTNDPNGTFAIGLTLFPLSAPITALLRMAFSPVPGWQLWVATGLVVLSLFVALLVVARIFRTAMLMYGQSLRPRQLLRALQQAES